MSLYAKYVALGGGGGTGAGITLAAFDSQAPTAAGLSLLTTVLSAQSADATHPGMVNTTTQSFAGNKTFTGTIGASNLSGTNTGDVTIGTASGLSLVGQALSLATANGSTTGALTGADWTTFNAKQAAGNYITALTGDATAAGPGSVAMTLATVNGNVGSFGSSTSIPTFTVNAKGLITAASGNVVIAPAGTLTGTTLAATVVTSSLTSVGTITSGVWTGTAIALANGGTGQVTKAPAFDALAPSSTKGDLIAHNGTNNIRLGVGANDTVLVADSAAAVGYKWATAPVPTPTRTTAAKSSDFTIGAGESGYVYLLDTTAARAVTMPSPVNGFYFTLVDSTGNASTNGVTYTRVGAEKFFALAQNLVVWEDFFSQSWISNGTDWFLMK